MNYHEYIASNSWKKKRKQRLEIDGHKCRLCDEDGSRFPLEVHHRPSSYEKIPNESVEDDLTTLCQRCHDLITSAIREDRYGRQELDIEPIEETNRKPEVNYGLERDTLPFDVIGPVTHAQRPACRSDEQMAEIDREDFIQEKKDRR